MTLGHDNFFGMLDMDGITYTLDSPIFRAKEALSDYLWSDYVEAEIQGELSPSQAPRYVVEAVSDLRHLFHEKERTLDNLSPNSAIAHYLDRLKKVGEAHGMSWDRVLAAAAEKYPLPPKPAAGGQEIAAESEPEGLSP